MGTSAQNVKVQAQVGLKAVVALLHVADVQRSVGFYQKLGFDLGNEPLKSDQGVQTFAWMHYGTAAQIMLTLAGKAANPGVSEVMFYLYVTDMPAYREQVISRGIEVGKVMYPFWSPGGEFQIDDPDGWTWMVC
jgi:predicted enzyme related to lactoylglutathione lyase